MASSPLVSSKGIGLSSQLNWQYICNLQVLHVVPIQCGACRAGIAWARVSTWMISANSLRTQKEVVITLTIYLASIQEIRLVAVTNSQMAFFSTLITACVSHLPLLAFISRDKIKMYSLPLVLKGSVISLLILEEKLLCGRKGTSGLGGLKVTLEPCMAGLLPMLATNFQLINDSNCTSKIETTALTKTWKDRRDFTFQNVQKLDGQFSYHFHCIHKRYQPAWWVKLDGIKWKGPTESFCEIFRKVEINSPPEISE